ncbi:transglutaminase family protein, partial [Rhizobiaceae sp. 2RAB30]
MAGPTQTIGHWNLAIDGAREELRFTDHFGNDTRLVSVEGEPHVIGVEASGEVETTDKAGVTGPHRGFTPLWLFAQGTPLTEAGEGIRAIADESGSDGGQIDRLHRLM